jgi:hypothetical protein
MQPERSREIQPLIPIWRAALGDESGARFAEATSPYVRLEGSIYAIPIDGRERVWATLRAAGAITDRLTFVRETPASDRSYLEWQAEALDLRFEGVTILGLDGAGLIENVALHHRPLGAVLAFSAEIGRRLGDSVGAGVFFEAADDG